LEPIYRYQSRRGLARMWREMATAFMTTEEVNNDDGNNRTV